MKEKITEDIANELIQSLALLKEKIPEAQTEKSELFLKGHIIYINTKLKAIENAKFWNMIKNDIEYYKQKEKLRLEKGNTDEDLNENFAALKTA